MGASRKDIFERALKLTAKWSDERLLPELRGGDGSRDDNALVTHAGIIKQLVIEFEVNRGTATGAVVRVIRARREQRERKLLEAEGAALAAA